MLNPTAIRLRSIARRLGGRQIRALFNKIIGRSGTDESRFRAPLLASIRENDVVWDVGANLGDYSELFLQRVGDSGTVRAFEPFPSCIDHMRERFRAETRITIEPFALGDQDRQARMQPHADPLGQLHQVIPDASDDNTVAGDIAPIDIHMRRGDSVADQRGETPNVIKIDVEGFELEVLHGLNAVLHAPACRAVFCEVHFSLLEQRGMPMAPVAIEKLLNEAGFRTEWLDGSHIGATRDLA